MSKAARLPRFSAAKGGEVGGKPNARQALARQLDRERKVSSRTKVKGLRQEIRSAKTDRKTGIRAAAERCALDRGRQKDRSARERTELAEKSKRERVLNKGICADRRVRVRTQASDRISAAKRELEAEQREQRFARTWSDPVMLGPRSARGAAGGKRAADLRRESDDEVKRNLPSELHSVWDRFKGRFKDEPHRSRTEAFEEWASEHRSQVDEQITRDLEQGLEDILATEQQDYEDRQAWASQQQDGGGSVGGAGDERIRIEWGVMPHRGGWLPILWVNRVPRSDTYGRPYEKGEALARAEAEAREHADRYSGDWDITIEPRGEVDQSIIDREFKAYTSRNRGSVGGVGDWQAEGRSWLGKVPRRRVPADVLDRAYTQLRVGDQARFDQARGAVLRALQRDLLGREVGAAQVPFDFDREVVPPPAPSQRPPATRGSTAPGGRPRVFGSTRSSSEPRSIKEEMREADARYGAMLIKDARARSAAQKRVACTCGGALCIQRIGRGLLPFCSQELRDQSIASAKHGDQVERTREALSKGLGIPYWKRGNFSELALRVLRMAVDMNERTPGVFLHPSVISDQLFGDSRKASDDDAVRTAFAQLRGAKKVRLQKPGKVGKREPVYVLIG